MTDNNPTPQPNTNETPVPEDGLITGASEDELFEEEEEEEEEKRRKLLFILFFLIAAFVCVGVTFFRYIINPEQGLQF